MLEWILELILMGCAAETVSDKIEALGDGSRHAGIIDIIAKKCPRGHFGKATC